VANLGGNELLDSVPGFGAAMRSYMVEVLSFTYQQIEVRLGAKLCAGIAPAAHPRNALSLS